MSTFQEQYKKLADTLKDELSLGSVMESPHIQKITLNMGVGEAVADKSVLDSAYEEMMLIAGQKPVITKARKSIAGFKVREGWPIGCKVTLRREKMYNFLERLVIVTIPRVRDFRGLSVKGFDGRGNYNMGVQEQIVFPEIDYDKIKSIRGMNITITTSAKDNYQGYRLLKLFRFPFKDEIKPE
jgi:large subunit ribosomal protein L5